MVHPLGQRAGVDEFGAVDAAGGGGGDVAEVIDSGAAGGEAEVLEFIEDVDGVLGLDLADLQVAAGRDVGVVAAPVVGNLGDAVELGRSEFAPGDAHPEHEGFLSGPDVEEAEIPELEGVPFIGEFVFSGVFDESVPGVEAVLFVLPDLGFAEVFDGGAVDGRRGEIGEAGIGVAGEETIWLVADEGGTLSGSGEEPGEVFLLLGGEGLAVGQGGRFVHGI